MGAVRTQRELELKAKLVAIPTVSVAREAILSANLAELTGPISKNGRRSFVGEAGSARAVRAIDAASQEPAPPQLIIERAIHAERPLHAQRLLTITPNKL